MKKLRRIISIMLALVLTITIVPQTNVANVDAATIKTTASLPVLGYTNNPITIGSKEQDEKWLQTKLNTYGPVFCLDLGETCRTGDEYSVDDSWNTWTTASSNEKHKLYSYIAAWYCNTSTNTRWIYAQALIWAVREGCTTKAKLKNVIQQLQDDPVKSGDKSYKIDYTTEELYNQIFDGGTYSVSYRIWKNENSNRQDLIEFKEYDDTTPQWTTLTTTEKYRQRVTAYKEDEFGNPLANVTFTLTVRNIMELDNIRAGNGSSSETTDGDDIKATSFSSSVVTGKKGLAYWRITYGLESEKIGYVKDGTLKGMNADDKALVKKQMDEKGIEYPASLSYDDAVIMANANISKQLNAIKNKYTLKENSTGDSNIIVSAEYANGKTFTLGSTYSWTKDEKTNKWPDETDGTYWNYQDAYIIKPITNNHKKITINIVKKDSSTSDGTPRGDLSLAGAEFGLFR